MRPTLNSGAIWLGKFGMGECRELAVSNRITGVWVGNGSSGITLAWGATHERMRMYANQRVNRGYPDYVNPLTIITPRWGLYVGQDF